MSQCVYLVQPVEGAQPDTSFVIFHKATHVIVGDAEFVLNGELLADSVFYLVHAVAEGSHPHCAPAVAIQ